MGGPINWVAVQAALQQVVVNGSGLPSGSVYWGQQGAVPGGAPRVAGPAIEMRISNQTDIGDSWLDFTDTSLTFGPAPVTAVDTGTGTLTIPAHGLHTGDGPFQFASTLTLPAPLVALTDYWLVVTGVDTFQLADSYVHTGGQQPLGAGNPVTALTITTVGSGTITMQSNDDTVSAGGEVAFVQRGLIKVTLALQCYTSVGVGMGMATSLLRRVASRIKLPTQHDLLNGVNVGLTRCERVRAIHGIKDAVLFEPRALLDIVLCMASEESDAPSTIIETVQVTDEITSKTTTIGPP